MISRMKNSLTLFAMIFSSGISHSLQAGDIVDPSEVYKPEEVIRLQLTSLMHNDKPYPDAGIAQTFAFAHPNNKRVTGPVEKFGQMLRLPAYQQLINHRSHEVKLFTLSDNEAFFGVKIIDANGNKVGFRWVVGKNNTDECQGCWMTVRVSGAIPIGQSI